MFSFSFSFSLSFSLLFCFFFLVFKIRLCFASCKLREIKFFLLKKQIRTYPLYLSDTFKKWIFSDTFKIQIKKVKIKKKNLLSLKQHLGLLEMGSPGLVLRCSLSMHVYLTLACCTCLVEILKWPRSNLLQLYYDTRKW